MAWDNGVSPPGGASYMAPLLNFSAFGDLANDYRQGKQGWQQIDANDQQKQLNQQKIQQQQQQLDLSKAFPNGLPTDPKTGAVDWGAVSSTFAKFGDPGSAVSAAQQAPPPASPMFGGQGAPAAPAGVPPAPSPSTSATAAQIIQNESDGNPNATSSTSTAAGLGGFTNGTWIESIKKYFPNLAQGRTDDQLLAMRKIPQLAVRVTEAFTAHNQAGLSKAGLPVTPATTYLAHFAGLGGAIKVLEARPDTPVSQILGDKVIKANSFLKGMTAQDLQGWAARKMTGPAMLAQTAQPAAGPQGGAPGQQLPARNVQVADASSDLPPSANAVTPRPQSGDQPASSFQDRFAAAGGGVAPQPQQAAPQQPQPQPPQQQPQPQAQPQPQPQLQQQAPQQPQPQPLVPQVPLPVNPRTGQRFTDPQEAILALNAEAAKYRNLPGGRGAGTALELDNYAKRIETSIQPVPIRQGETLLDPRTGQPIFQGNQPTLSPDAINAAAERYIETGQLPPNMGRGVQGNATMSAIQNQAATIANQRGIDMSTLPGKWQQFKAQQVAIQRFTSGKQGDTIKSFNVLVDHLDTLGDAASALKNGDIRFFNKWKQNFAAQTGGTAPTNFDGVKALVGDEIVKAVVGGAGALADREEVKKDLDRASSPKQLAELVDKYRKLALGQLKGLRKQYEVATGQKNFGDLLLPGTLAALGGGEAESAPKVTPSGVNWSIEK